MLLRRDEVAVKGWGEGDTLLWSEIMSGYNTPDTMVEIGA